MPFQTDIDDKGYQQTVFDPNYWQQEAQKYAAAVATGNVQTHKPAVPPPPIISSMTETPAGTVTYKYLQSLPIENQQLQLSPLFS